MSEGTLQEPDRVKAIIDMDKTEYQRLQQEIYFRLQARATLLRAQLTVTGFAAVIVGPGTALLQGIHEDRLLPLVVSLCITTAMALFSLILYYEMVSHDRHVGRAAIYMHNIIRPRMLKLLKPPTISYLADDGDKTRSFGLLDWEAFLAVWKERVLYRKFAVIYHVEAWLRGETIPILVAVLAWLGSTVLIFTNLTDYGACELNKMQSCPLVVRDLARGVPLPYGDGFYNGLILSVATMMGTTVLLLFGLARGAWVHVLVSREFGRIVSDEAKGT